MDWSTFNYHGMHIIVGLFSLVGLYIWIRLVVKYRGRWLIALGPLSYFLHVLAFNAVATFFVVNPVDLNTWSNAIRLHSMFLVGALGVFLMDRYKSRLPPV